MGAERKNKIMLISIIVPAYNCENTISNCIESLIVQTYRNIEIIIVDDGSKDNTYDIASKYSCNDNRIVCIKQDNAGPGAARNSGMRLAKGQYFTFVDADDTVETTYIESMVDAANTYKLELVICNVSVYGRKRKHASGGCNIIAGDKEVKSEVISLIKRGMLNAPVAKLYRLDIQKKYGICMPTETDIGEDLQINLAYIKYVTRMGMLDVNLYIYYKCNSTLTKKYRNNEYDVRVRNIKGLETFLDDNGLSDKQFISYLYLKLMYAECMSMRKHLKKEERLFRIEELLHKEDVQKAIEELRPIGMIQKIMLFGTRKNKVSRIDFVAFILNVGKVFGRNVKRASV